jgi:hypothetical protein
MAQEDYGPGCPRCTTQAVQLPASTPGLHTSMKWSGISQAPSIANPALGCQMDFKTLMWRRHERASDCIWIPQCRITLRSGGAISSTSYIQFGDLDTSIGIPGDVEVSPLTELVNPWTNADTLWAAQPKGIIAVSAKRLIDSSGAYVARGIAYQGSITKPYLMVSDLSILNQLDERSLAHEAGHVLSLPHTASGLMQTGGTGGTLTTAECTTVRTYLSTNTILDPPSDLVDFLFDTPGDPGINEPWLNMDKTVVVDDSASGRDVYFAIGCAGLMPEQPVDSVWWVLLLRRAASMPAMPAMPSTAVADGAGTTGIDSGALKTTGTNIEWYRCFSAS